MGKVQADEPTDEDQKKNNSKVQADEAADEDQ